MPAQSLVPYTRNMTYMLSTAMVSRANILNVCISVRGRFRIYKRGGLIQGTNLLGGGVLCTPPSMLELGGSGGMPPREIFER